MLQKVLRGLWMVGYAVGLILLGYTSGRQVSNKALTDMTNERDQAQLMAAQLWDVSQEAIALAKHFKQRCARISL